MSKDLYFTKDHDMVRKAVREFVQKEINPYVDMNGKNRGMRRFMTFLRKWEIWVFWASGMIRSTAAKALTTGMSLSFWKKLIALTAGAFPLPFPFRPIWPHRHRRVRQ